MREESRPKMKNVFDILKEKLQKKPDRYFDQQFWTKFEAEFGNEPAPSYFRMHRWIQITLVAGLSVIAVFASRSYFDNMPVPEDMRQSMAIMSEVEMYENLDMFLTFDDVNLSDEDWEILLKDTNPKES
jgi:hypothetical protein